MPTTQPITTTHCKDCHVPITAGDLCVDCGVEAYREAEREAMWKRYVTKSNGECDEGEPDDDEVPRH
jgi:hypothetical protein